MSEEHHEEEYEDNDVANQDVDAVEDSDDVERADGGSTDEPIDDTATNSSDDDDVADWGFGEKKSRFGKEVVIAFGAIAVLLGMFGWVVHNQMNEAKDGGVVAGDIPEGTLGGAGDDPFMPVSLGAAEGERGPVGDEEFLPPVQNDEPDEHSVAMNEGNGNTGRMGNDEPFGDGQLLDNSEPLVADRSTPNGLFDAPANSSDELLADDRRSGAGPDFGQTETGRRANSVVSRDSVFGGSARRDAASERFSGARADRQDLAQNEPQPSVDTGRLPDGAIGGLDDAGGTLSTEDRPFNLFEPSTGAEPSPALVGQKEPLIEPNAVADPAVMINDPFLSSNDPLPNPDPALSPTSEIRDPFAAAVEPEPLIGNEPLLSGNEPLLDGNEPLLNNPGNNVTTMPRDLLGGPELPLTDTPANPGLPRVESNSLLSNNSLDLGNSEPLVTNESDSLFGPLSSGNSASFDEAGSALADSNDPLISVREPSGASSLPDASPVGLLDEPALRDPQPVTLGNSGISNSGISGSGISGSGFDNADPFAPVATPIDGNATTFDGGGLFEPAVSEPTNLASDDNAFDAPAIAPDLSPAGTGSVTRTPGSEKYVIESGDSFWSISKKVYGEGKYFRDLAQFNRGTVPNPEKLKVGTEIQTPSLSVLRPAAVSGSTPQLAVAELQPTISPVVSRLEDSVTARRAVIDASDKPSGIYFSSQGYPMYRVGRDDNLTSISADHLGRASRWKQVFAMNRDILQSPSDLQVGMVLKLPADASKVPLTERTSSLR
jgi:hypothetical protein